MAVSRSLTAHSRGISKGINSLIAAMSLLSILLATTSALSNADRKQMCFATPSLFQAQHAGSFVPSAAYLKPSEVYGQSFLSAARPNLFPFGLRMAEAGSATGGIFVGVSDAVKTAMKAKDTQRLSALRGIKAALQTASKVSNVEVLPDADCVPILRKLAKQRAESIEAFTAGGRLEMADGEKFELGVINEYLPQLADEATTRKWIEEAIAESGANNAGKVMGMLMKSHKVDSPPHNRPRRRLVMISKHRNTP